MAAECIRVDYNQLTTLHTRLQTAASNMRDDSLTMNGLADYVGDEKLAGRIREFGKDWRVHRANLLENVEWMQEKVKQVADEFKKIDGDLATGLTSAPAPTRTPTKGPTAV